MHVTNSEHDDNNRHIIILKKLTRSVSGIMASCFLNDIADCLCTKHFGWAIIDGLVTSKESTKFQIYITYYYNYYHK